MADGEANYNPDDFGSLRPSEDSHFWFVSRNEILAAAMAHAVDRSTAASVLEIGCGTGNTLRMLRESIPNGTLVGMDAFHEGLLHARGRTDASLVEGRIEHLPFHRPFDVVGMFDVLEHIEDDFAALRAIRESLTAGGKLVLTVPASPALWSRYDEECRHQRRYTAPRLRQVLAAAQFRVDYLTYFMTATYPFLWLSRRLERAFAAISGQRTASNEPVIDRELRVPALMNGLFRQLLRPEAAAIRSRRQLPFGASLLAIATA